MDIKHLHAHHHSHSGAFASVLKFDSDNVFEAPVTRQMRVRLGVGEQISASYAHHMLGKAERPWRTLRDNASAMLRDMAVPNSIWSCVVSTVVYLRKSVSPVVFPSPTLWHRRQTRRRSAPSGAPSSPKCPTMCVGNSAKKRFVAPWSAIRLTPMGTASTTPSLTASPLPSMSSSTLTPRASARASLLTRSSQTPRMTSPLWTPRLHPTLSTPHCPTLNPLLQPPVRLDSGRTPSATGTLWPTCLITHRHLLHRVVIWTRVKPRRTSSTNPACHT
jgi:hypothetical protein